MPVNTTLRRTLSGAISLALIGAAGLVATPAFAVGPTTFPAEFTVDDTAKTITLTSDFEATETIVIPDGYTFDGAGNTVYATGATWQGPVVANDGAGDIAVTDLAIIRTVVDARWDNDSTYGNQTVAGITVKNGALTASDVHIEGIRGTTLNQNGYGILVLNTTLTTPATVLVDGADISTYTKGGVYVFGQTTTATIRNSTIGGGILGAATNPIMISAGAESTIQDNVIAGGQWKDSTAQSTGILFYGAGDSTVKGNAISGADVAIAIDPGETTDGRYEGGKISSQVALAGNSLTAPSSIPSGGNVPVGIRVVTGKTGTVKHFANTFSSYQAANELVSESADGLTVAPLYVAPTVGLTRIPSTQDWGSVRVTISGNTADSRVPASYAVTLFKDGKAVTTKSSLAISTTTVDFPLSSAGSYTAEVKLTAMGGQVANTSTAVVVAAATFTTTPKPVITGSAKVGAKLTASAGTWVPSATLAYQWNRDSSTISGATGSTYTLTGADYGKAITVKVTGTRTGYTTVSQTSAATAKVAAATMTAAKPAISGTAKVGKTLTAKPGTWKPSGVTFSYQWYRSGKAISKATKSTYTLTSADLGKTITVKVTGKATGYTTASQTSKATSKVGVGTITKATPAISGTAKVGKTLTAKPGTWKPSGVKFSYQWYRSGKAISKATKSTYKLVKADVGKTITVKVTGKATGYSTASKTSKATAKVLAGTVTKATPKISGTAKVGKTLTAKPGTWKPSGVTFSYQWYRDGKAVSKATKSTYKLVKADKGKKITVKVTGKRSGYASASATSKATKKVTT